LIDVVERHALFPMAFPDAVARIKKSVILSEVRRKPNAVEGPHCRW